MTFLILGIAVYFLPTIIGHNKRNAAGIFLLNFFLGWTIIGWIAALIWACASDAPAPVVVVAGPAGNYCSRCGNIRFPSARFCNVCGNPF